MKALVILTFLLGVMAMIQFVPTSSVDSQRSQSIAMNYAVFRNAVYLSVFNGNKASGSVDTAALDLPDGFVLLRAWKARVEADCLYVWGPASSEEIEAARDLFWGSLAMGRASAGFLVPDGVTPVPGFVPEDNLVSVVGVN